MADLEPATSFESNNGPFWHRFEDDGSVRCAFRVEKPSTSTACATSMAAAT